jgi:superfamily I DNA/RNA helicase
MYDSEQGTIQLPKPSSRLQAPGQGASPLRFPPTGEQQAIIDAYNRGERIVVEALAGTGKTTTLKLIAAQQPNRPGLYLAFNKTVAREAEGSMPGRVTVSTAHALAYKAIGNQYGHRLPGNPGATRMSAKRMATKLRVKAAQLDTGTLNPVVVTRMAQATVANYIKSDSREIHGAHIPARVLQHHNIADIASIVVPLANRIWEDLTDKQGQFYFTHDHYLKMWALTNPVLPASYIMFDEAQDADPVIASIVARQTAQLIYVGDKNQAIYGWRGAVDALSKVEGATRLPLTKSFRFGPAVAEQANNWLEMLGSDYRVVGHDPIPSTVGELAEPRAILCRSNGTALGWVLSFQGQQIPVALAPGDRSAGKDIERFAWAARDLMNGEGTDHPDLVGFTTWSELVTFVEEEEDTADLKRMVGIINRVGYPAVIDAIRNLVPEGQARVTVSTAHKAKGLEWDTVKVADDFTPPEMDDEGKIEVDPADLMLAYVTVTRAKLRLDPGSLGEPHLWKS